MTYADLAALTADLPAALIEARPPHKPVQARARPPVGKVVLAGTAVIIPPATVLAAFLTGKEHLARLSFLIIPLSHRLDPRLGSHARQTLPQAAYRQGQRSTMTTS